MSNVAGHLVELAMPPVDQIGTVVRNLDTAIDEMSALGIGPWYRLPLRQGEVEIRSVPQQITLRIAMAMLGAVQIELIEPVEGNSIHKEFLETRGEGLHHVGFMVSDFDERLAAMTARGIEILHGRREDGRLVVAYLDTKQTSGVLIELLRPTPMLVKVFDRVKHLGKVEAR